MIGGFFKTERVALGVLAALLGAAPAPARAEASEVRIAEQYGIAYLPIHVAIERRLIEARATAAGLSKVKIKLERFGGGIAVNQAVLSGRSDIGAGDIAAMVSLWARTRGGDSETRGMTALATMPLKFITNDPRVKTVKDYAGLGGHRIALPSTKISAQAVVLQMAAEKAFGPGQHDRLDAMAAAMPHPWASSALIAGHPAIKTHIATPPYSFREVASGKGRVIASSYDMVGGPHSSVVLFATKKWKTANPKLFQAIDGACREAIDWINADFRRAATFYLERMDARHDLSEIETVLADRGQIVFDSVPTNTLSFAQFMQRTGAIEAKPAAWTDYFWETAHGPGGG